MQVDASEFVLSIGRKKMVILENNFFEISSSKWETFTLESQYEESLPMN